MSLDHGFPPQLFQQIKGTSKLLLFIMVYIIILVLIVCFMLQLTYQFNREYEACQTCNFTKNNYTNYSRNDDQSFKMDPQHQGYFNFNNGEDGGNQSIKRGKSKQEWRLRKKQPNINSDQINILIEQKDGSKLEFPHKTKSNKILPYLKWISRNSQEQDNELSSSLEKRKFVLKNQKKLQPISKKKQTKLRIISENISDAKIQRNIKPAKQKQFQFRQVNRKFQKLNQKKLYRKKPRKVVKIQRKVIKEKNIVEQKTQKINNEPTPKNLKRKTHKKQQHPSNKMLKPRRIHNQNQFNDKNIHQNQFNNKNIHMMNQQYNIRNSAMERNSQQDHQKQNDYLQQDSVQELKKPLVQRIPMGVFFAVPFQKKLCNDTVHPCTKTIKYTRYYKQKRPNISSKQTQLRMVKLKQQQQHQQNGQKKRKANAHIRRNPYKVILSQKNKPKQLRRQYEVNMSIKEN